MRAPLIDFPIHSPWHAPFLFTLLFLFTSNPDFSIPQLFSPLLFITLSQSSVFYALQHTQVSQFFSHLFHAFHHLILPLAPCPLQSGNSLLHAAAVQQDHQEHQILFFHISCSSSNVSSPGIWPTLTLKHMQHRWNQRFKLLKSFFSAEHVQTDLQADFHSDNRRHLCHTGNAPFSLSFLPKALKFNVLSN